MAIEAQMYADFGLDSSSNVCGFDNLCFVPQQQQQHQSQQFDQFQSFSHGKNQGFFQGNNVQQSVPFSQSFSAHFEKQRMEIDQFINFQNEKLRQAIQEQRKHQISALMKKYEAKTQFLLQQKQEEIAKVSNRAMELEILLKRIEVENQMWQRVAKENEAMIGSLNDTIQRLRETACLSANAAEDAQSCCQNMEAEEPKRSNVEEIKRKIMCKCCNSRKSCVVMLPCRHICSCKECEVFLDSCPVCRMVKKSSIEALF